MMGVLGVGCNFILPYRRGARRTCYIGVIVSDRREPEDHEDLYSSEKSSLIGPDDVVCGIRSEDEVHPALAGGGYGGSRNWTETEMVHREKA